jgi:hypothetical protein
VLDAIDRDPPPGLPPGRPQPVPRGGGGALLARAAVTRQLHMLLAPHGLAYLVKRISDEYPSTAYRVVTENPYELTRVFGVGFKVADRIARAGLGRAGPGAIDVDRPGAPPPRSSTRWLRPRAAPAAPACRWGAAERRRELLGPHARSRRLSMSCRGRRPDARRRLDLPAATWELEQELAERIGRCWLWQAAGKLKPVDPDAAGGGSGGELDADRRAA